MGVQILLRGNYIDNRKPVKPNKQLATLLEYEGDEGKCWLKLVYVEDLDFLVKWQPFSLRGYQQFCRVPEEHRLKIDGAVERWNWMIPENGSIHFCETKAERDANLVEDFY